MENCSKKIEDRIDRLSDLPDGILHHLLSFLDTKSSIATSILSRRWRSVWKYVPVLAFTEYSFGSLSGFLQFVPRFFALRSDSSRLRIVTADFPIEQRVDVFDTMMAYAASHGVQELFIRGCCYLDSDVTSLMIGQEPSVRKINVGLWSRLQLLETLTLTQCAFTFGDGADDDVFANFPRLETLKLDNCLFSGRSFGTSILKVSGPKLRSLEIIAPLFNSFEIVAPKLQSFRLEIDALNGIQLDTSKSDLHSLRVANIEVLRHRYKSYMASSKYVFENYLYMDAQKQQLSELCVNLFKVMHNVETLDMQVETFEEYGTLGGGPAPVPPLAVDWRKGILGSVCGSGGVWLNHLMDKHALELVPGLIATVSETIMVPVDHFNDTKEKLKSILNNVSSKLSLSLDSWTSYEHIVYMSVTCHWIDDDWCFQSVLLDICRIRYPYDGSDMHYCLKKVLSEYGIENKILSCTHGLTELDGFQEDNLVTYLPCAANALQQLIDSGLSTTKSCISKIRELVLELNSSRELSEEFLKLAKENEEGGWEFPLQTTTRWSGNYYMLDLVIKASESVKGAMKKYDENIRSSNELELSSKEMEKITSIHGYLKSFHDTTNEISKVKFLTVGFVVLLIDDVFDKLRTDRDSLPSWLQSLVDDMDKKAKEYTTKVNNTTNYISAILDPRIKKVLIPTNILSGSTFLFKAMEIRLEDYSSPMAYEVEDQGGADVSLAEAIMRRRVKQNWCKTSKDELIRYLKLTRAPISTNVLQWWKNYSSMLPRLAAMARDFLAVQPTAVAPEVLFSSIGDAIDMRRRSMPHENIREVLCGSSWLSQKKIVFGLSEIEKQRLAKEPEKKADDIDRRNRGRRPKKRKMLVVG
ncbi:Putative AC transposase [Linum grandiflorum]